MGVKTVYTCDNCGYILPPYTDAPERQFWYIGISCDTTAYAKTLVKQQLWCRNCTDTYGLTPTPKDKPQPTPVTFEDTIRELIRSEMENV